MKLISKIIKHTSYSFICYDFYAYKNTLRSKWYVPKVYMDGLHLLLVLSEKYDGYRARWMPNENHFLSRSNKVYTGTPDWFLGMPMSF